MKALKWILMAIAGLFVLVVAAVFLVIATVDPNTLKPELEKQLAKQNLYLELDGEIDWQLWPSIGLQIEGARLIDAPDSQEVLVSLQHMGFGLQLMPLFSGKVLVDDIVVAGVTVNYHVMEDGSTNWDTILGDASETTDTTTAEPVEASEAPLLNVSVILVKDILVNYQDDISQSDLTLALSLLQLNSLNLAGDAFEMVLEASATLPELPPILLSLTATARFDASAQVFSLDEAQSLVTLADGTLALSSTATVALTPLKVDAKLAVNSDSVRALLSALAVELPADTLKSDALQRFRFDTDLQFDGTTATLPNTHIQLDSTVFSGDTTVTLKDSGLPAVTSVWNSSLIDTNAFLLPPVEGEAGPATTEQPVAEAEPVPLPMPLLRELDAAIDINIQTLMYQALAVESIALKLRAKEGVISLPTISAAIQEGALAAQAELDATKDEATLEAKASTVDLDLGYVSDKIADVKNIGGFLNSRVSATSFGTTDVALIENLDADIEADSAQLRIIPINLMKSVCQAVAFAEQKSLEPREWPEFTDLTPLTLTAKLTDQKATLNTFTASVEKFNATATGDYDLRTGDFNVPFQLKLADFGADIEGCNFISESWRKIALPLRCKGNVDAFGVDTCLPDKSLLKNLAKQRVKQEVDKQKDKLEKKAESLLKDKIGEEGTNLLRGLFN